MLQKKTLFAAFAAVALLIACSRATERDAALSAASEGEALEVAPMQFKTARPDGLAANNWTSVADSSMLAKPKPMSSSAAVHNGDTIRRFIRTADLRFRVKDVVSATYAIEDLIAGFGGFVEHTRLSSNVDHRYTTPVSADSVLETTRYTVVNRATLRVPVSQLDTALKSLARFVDFMDHRTVQAEDVRLMILANRLAQRRIAEHARRTQQAVDEHGKKLRDVADAQDALLRRQEQADEATLSTLRLEDRIAYSTIAIEIYQRQAVRHEMLANERNIARYEPGFFSKLAGAVAEGWRMLLRFILFLAGNWSIILLALGAFWLLRRFFRSKGQG